MDIKAERERLKGEIENLIGAINHRHGQLAMLDKLEQSEEADEKKVEGG